MGHKSSLPVVKHDIYVKYEFCSNDKSFSNVFHLVSLDIIHQITLRKLLWIERLGLRWERDNKDRIQSELSPKESESDKTCHKLISSEGQSNYQ